MPVTRAFEMRDGSVEDLPELRRILTSANEPYRAVLGTAAFTPYLDMVLALDERIDVAELIVASDRGKAVGTVTFYRDAAEGWGWPIGLSGIRSMGVDPAAQRCGAGAALLDECRRRALSHDANGIALHTASFLPAAIRLYERYGFTRDPAHDIRASDVMDLPDASLDFEALAYRLDLPR